MIFWDTSAIVPLIVEEPETSGALARLREDPTMVVWWGSLVEGMSAIERLAREGVLQADERAEATARLKEFAGAWHEIVPVDDVRDHARRLLARHPLTAADALQLGAALTWADARPAGHRFRTHDHRLASAARGEGFEVEGADG